MMQPTDRLLWQFGVKSWKLQKESNTSNVVSFKLPSRGGGSTAAIIYLPDKSSDGGFELR